MMKITANICLILLTIVASNTVYGQKSRAIFDFEDILCTYQGYYDDSKFTEQELTDTYALVDWMLYFTGEDLEGLALSYQESKKNLQALRLVSDPVFKSARDSMLRYVDESYAIQRIRMQAEEDPNILLSLFQENEMVKYYAEALVENGERLLNAYKRLTREQMAKNAAPDLLWRKYEANVASEDRYLLAFDYVLTYGWWNQVNGLIYHFTHDASLHERFHNLFETVVTVDCDEP